VSEHKKFELEELPKSAVVNSNAHSQDEETMQLINEVVTEHISKIVDDVNIGEPLDEIKKNLNNESVVASTDPIIDVEQIKLESYNRGLEESKSKYEPMLTKLNENNNFFELLHQKLSSILPEEKIDSQISKISAESIAGIAKKLHLILPSNFEEIIRVGLIEKLKNFYKEGNITITIHPRRYDFCKEILQSDTISSKFKDNFQIVKDDKIGEDDCRLEWADTRLEYNQEQLTAEIDKIIEQLKSAT
jgi:flagellar biosynthesis/type III secretory pathway protein FliH